MASKDQPDVPIGQFPAGPRAFRIEVRDDANSPELLAGDRLIIDPDKTPVPGNVCLARNGDTLSLGRYRPKGDVIEIVPINTGWPTLALPASAIFGVMTERSRRLR